MADTTPTAVPSTPPAPGMAPGIVRPDGMVRAQDSATRSQVIANTLAANRTPIQMGADRAAIRPRPATQTQNAE